MRGGRLRQTGHWNSFPMALYETARILTGFIMSRIVEKAHILHQPNAFLAALPPSELQFMRNFLRPMTLNIRERLHRFGEEIEQVIFPSSGVVTTRGILRNGPAPISALIGRDGIVGGLAATAAVGSMFDADVSISGIGLRISATDYRKLLEARPPIRHLAARFEAALVAQIMQFGACNAVHKVENRLCRLLLVFQDCVGGSGRLHLTQSDLGGMLGVRRTTITLLAGRLEACGAILSRHGSVEVLRRDELEAWSCGCESQISTFRSTLFSGPGSALH